MNTYNNKLIVRRYFEEVLLKGRSELIEELFIPEVCDLVRRYAFFASEPFTISDVIAEDDTVMVHWKSEPFSGAGFAQSGFAVCHLGSGRIVGLEMTDVNGISRQVGAEAFPVFSGEVA